jgi:AcrR family transcriptional regulator
MTDTPDTPETVALLAPANARERVLEVAHQLFWAHGVGAVGVDRIVAEAGVAKTTLYRHFASKDALVVAVLKRHEETWTQAWLAEEAVRRATPASPGIVAIFDALDEWYAADRFDGDLFANTLLETRATGPVREASIEAIENVYALLTRLAEDAGVRDADAFAHQIQILMRGSIVAAVEGHLEAVRQARATARLLLERATAQ